jgi:two-component system, LytTR family, sensor histidine kinase AlgZ
MDKDMSWLFKYRIWWHLIFWLVWYFFYTFTYSTGILEKNQFIQNFYLLPVRMTYTYLLIYWILPEFLFKKKYIPFIFLTIIHTILFGYSIWLVLYLVTGYKLNDSIPFIRSIVLNYQILPRRQPSTSLKDCIVSSNTH